MWYEMKVDLDIDSFLIQRSEVDEIKWIKYEKLVEDIKINPDKYLLSLVKKIREGFFD